MGSGSVSTVTGTGVQGNDKEGGGKERLQGINSPWDLALGGKTPSRPWTWQPLATLTVSYLENFLLTPYTHQILALVVAELCCT